jgi:hypothetical protein
MLRMRNWIFMVACTPMMAQIVIGGSTPALLAILDMPLTDKGMLFPQMTKAKRDVIFGNTSAAPSWLRIISGVLPGVVSSIDYGDGL